MLLKMRNKQYLQKLLAWPYLISKPLFADSFTMLLLIGLALLTPRCFCLAYTHLLLHIALPNITTQPSSKTIRKGETNVTAMSCNVTGMGPIYFRWERYNTINSSWIAPSHRAVSTMSPSLIFSVINEEDEGVYHCIVTNDDGSIVSDNATTFVYGENICTIMYTTLFHI